MTFVARYHDGQIVKIGDVVTVAGSGERNITNIFPPDHEISIYYEMEDGCVEISPATIESVPLNEDIDLVRRGDK